MNLIEARNLAVWGFPWQSNPYCRLSLGSQLMRSRKDDATSHRGSHKAPFWNQEFIFLVTDNNAQVGSCAADWCSAVWHTYTLQSVQGLLMDSLGM